MSRNMYFVMDMDYNTFNSKRQQSYLEGIADAATFKLLNKCLPDIDDKKLFLIKDR